MTRQAFKYGIAICHTHTVLPCSHYKAKDLSVDIMTLHGKYYSIYSAYTGIDTNLV